MITQYDSTLVTITPANITRANSSTANSKEDINPRTSFRNGAPIGVSQHINFSIFIDLTIVLLSHPLLLLYIGMILASRVVS